MAKTWIEIARARDVPVPQDSARFVASLDALESAFRPLVATIPFETEPALILSEAAFDPE